MASPLPTEMFFMHYAPTELKRIWKTQDYKHCGPPGLPLAKAIVSSMEVLLQGHPRHARHARHRSLRRDAARTRSRERLRYAGFAGLAMSALISAINASQLVAPF